MNRDYITWLLLYSRNLRRKLGLSGKCSQRFPEVQGHDEPDHELRGGGLPRLERDPDREGVNNNQQNGYCFEKLDHFE